MGHTSEKLCYCGDAYIVNNGMVLLHLHQKYQIWTAPGGHVDEGENPFQAAAREGFEETGLVLKPFKDIDIIESDYFYLPEPLSINQHSVGEGRSHISFAFGFSSKNREIHPGEGEAPTEFKWFSKEELESSELNIPPNVRLQGVKAIELIKSFELPVRK